MADPAQRDAALERYGALVEKFEHAGGYTFENRIRQTLSGVGFAPQDFSRPVNQLSGGQKTRALLGQARAARAGPAAARRADQSPGH